MEVGGSRADKQREPAVALVRSGVGQKMLGLEQLKPQGIQQNPTAKDY